MPRNVIVALFALSLLQAADSPLAPGAKPKNEGAIGAGEGPAWHSGTGSLYFTGANRITRRDSAGRVTVFRESAGGANGVLVSPDDRFLYVADNNNNNVGGARKLWRFRLKRDGAIDPASRKLIFDWQDGRGPDGFKMDQKGRLYVAAGLNKPHPPFESADTFKGGVYILSPEGKLLDFIAIPVDEVTNCAFGGADLKTFFIAAGGTLWSIRVDTAGAVRKYAHGFFGNS